MEILLFGSVIAVYFLILALDFKREHWLFEITSGAVALRAAEQLGLETINSGPREQYALKQARYRVINGRKSPHQNNPVGKLQPQLGNYR